jgi:hypothetical protein
MGVERVSGARSSLEAVVMPPSTTSKPYANRSTKDHPRDANLVYTLWGHRGFVTGCMCKAYCMARLAKPESTSSWPLANRNTSTLFPSPGQGLPSLVEVMGPSISPSLICIMTALTKLGWLLQALGSISPRRSFCHSPILQLRNPLPCQRPL